MLDALTETTASGRRLDDRRQFEHHWMMNPATRAILDDAVDAAMAARGGVPLDLVLDVGCGAQSNVVFPGARRVIGTDLDLEGLKNNLTVDAAIAADIVATDLPTECVDAIACIYVLEHVPHPDRVFGKFARALRPGGVLIIAVPNVAAPKARVTRLTPLSFHRFVYRRLLSRKGDDEGMPFATVLDGSIRPDRLENLAEVCGLIVLRRTDFEDNKQLALRRKFKLTGLPWNAIRAAFRGMSRGRMDPELSDIVMVLQRPFQDPATGTLAESLAAAQG
jgi:SAM-dependent methyltransferase